MNTLINHEVRKKLGLTAIHMIVLEALDTYNKCGIMWTKNGASEDVGLSVEVFSKAYNYLSSTTPQLIIDGVPTMAYYSAFVGDAPKVSAQDDSLAVKVIEFFNELNETRYEVTANMHLIKAIVKQNPGFKYEHFKAVISHKAIEWGQDEKMSSYNRPQTIFRNASRFGLYFDEAQAYFRKQLKQKSHEGTITAAGH